jgi:hypothetical protein
MDFCLSAAHILYGMQYLPEYHRHFIEGNISAEEYRNEINAHVCQRMQDEGFPLEAQPYRRVEMRLYRPA